MSKRALLGKRLFSKEGFKGFGYGLSRIGNRERERASIYRDTCQRMLGSREDSFYLNFEFSALHRSHFVQNRWFAFRA